MGHAERTATRRYLDDLISLLDREEETRGSAQRADLEIALAVLRDEAFRGGASERTVSLIQAVQVALAFQTMPRDADALQ